MSLTLAVGGLGMLAFSVLQAQARETTGVQASAPLDEDSPSERIGSQVQRRGQLVQTELLGLHGQHAWAGDYYEGDGLGMNVRVLIAPGAGVSSTWRGCTGMYAQNEGEVLMQADGSLKLNYAHSTDGPFKLPTQLRPVRWGERVYLIGASDPMTFINSINMGEEPRTTPYGHVLLRKGDEDKAVVGLPDLPADQLAAIRSVALNLKVTASRRTSSEHRYGYCTDAYDLTFDRGTVDGIRPGVELRLVSKSPYGERVRIVSAQPEASVAEWRDVNHKCGKDRGAELRRWVFSTGSYPEQPAM
ncbi:hypothetical protein [Lysobacter capsici]|uniref:hypothetical protein n=1 Tax=Lysobacter capsici TaxID=435897 RepID=UPI001C0065CA|nr:hypothetical protein [Lysobacter capsici]QWF15654.1 hypothetical protein KME82_17940 [Lysobacter capsici]